MVDDALPLPAALHFGRFELRPQQRQLLADGHAVAIGGRAFDVLVAMALRPGQLLSKQLLLDLAWPGLVVEEGNLAVQVSNLRKVLGSLIATVPGRGYRFVAEPRAAGPTARGLAPAPAHAPRSNLPDALTPLVGRDETLAALGALLDACRLVTLGGPGGAGKTLLAQHLLARRRERHAHGVCMVELAPLADGAAVPAAIAGALGLPLAEGAGSDALDALAAALAPLDVLIALDNAEHVLDGVAAVAARLLTAAPRLRLLVTSQAPLRVADEQRFRLGALTLPPADAPPPSAAVALGYGAVALFARRAAAADARFALTDADVPAVVALCRALDGLPLAIELAAARLPALGAQRLLQAMEQRLRVLGAARRDAPARHQTLRAALAWSIGLLDAREQALFRRLAVVVDSASLELVQQLGADDGLGLDEWGVLDALDSLIQRSLVQVLDDQAPGAPPRYRLLESPRAYAAECLQQAGETAALQRRHAEAIAALLQAAEAARWDAGASDDIGALERARLDIGNARAALAWALSSGAHAAALQLARLLPELMRLESTADLLAVCATAEALLAAEPAPLERARVWLALARNLVDLQPQRALAAARHGLAAARDAAAAADAPLLYLLLCEVASHEALRGVDNDGQTLLDEARALEQPAWSARLRSVRPNAAFRIHLRRGRLADALREAIVARALACEAGMDPTLLDATLVDLHLAAGDRAAAVAAGRALVARLAGTRRVQELAYAQLNLAAACLTIDAADEAQPLLAAAWAAAQTHDHIVPYVADYLALLAACRGRASDAAELAGFADAAYAARSDARQANEAAAIDRACGLAAAALGAAEADRLRARGRGLAAVEVAVLAFGAFT